jgi:hypothetical protein
MAKRESKHDFAGAGCAIQGLGLLAPVVGLLAGPVGFTAGLLVMVALFIVGSAKSKRWICGNCRNPLADKGVRMCPTCRADLT